MFSKYIDMPGIQHIRSVVKLLLHLLISAFIFLLLFFIFTRIYPLSSTNFLSSVRFFSKYVPYAVSAIGGILTFLGLHALKFDRDKDGIYGDILIPAWLAKILSKRKTWHDSYPFFWGGLWLPFSSGVKGMVAIGARGSGKTVTIRLFLQSVVKHIGAVPGHRALIYDAKRDMYQILSGIGADISLERGLINNLNPYDVRSCAWELCDDIRDIKTLAEVSRIFIPSNSEADESRANQARSLLTEVLKSFVLSGGYWTLRDVYAATKTAERLRFVLGQHPETSTGIRSFLENGETTDELVSMLQSQMERYEVIAALWEQAEYKISLTAWLNDENGRIILLGHGERGSALEVMNQLIVSSLGWLIADPTYPDSDVRRTWLVFDDPPQCWQFDLNAIATSGYSKGVGLVIGVQDNESHNDNDSGELSYKFLNTCRHKAILALRSEPTAQWAANEFGKQEVIKDEQRKVKFAVPAFKFLSKRRMSEMSLGRGIRGYYKIDGIGAYKKKLWGWWLFGIPALGLKGKLDDLDTIIQGYIQRDDSQQVLMDWTSFDLDRLGYQWELIDLVKLNIEYEASDIEEFSVQSDTLSDLLADTKKSLEG